jgi:hypothetical protein
MAAPPSSRPAILPDLQGGEPTAAVGGEHGHAGAADLGDRYVGVPAAADLRLDLFVVRAVQDILHPFRAVSPRSELL